MHIFLISFRCIIYYLLWTAFDGTHSRVIGLSDDPMHGVRTFQYRVRICSAVGQLRPFRHHVIRDMTARGALVGARSPIVGT